MLSPSPTVAPAPGACARTRAEVRNPCRRRGALDRAASPGVAVRVVALLRRRLAVGRGEEDLTGVVGLLVR
ncbi:hypothetical protein C3K23_27700 [Streptomyces sp. 604F]|nr:hypothetical protein C3K23_27700 [Streptomyces sp. 604F]